MEQLQVTARAVQEHKHLSAAGVPFQLIAHQPTQPVKALAHIARLPVQVVAMGGTKAEHLIDPDELGNKSQVRL